MELVVELRGKAALGARAWVQGKGSGAANPCPEGRSRGSKAAKCKRGFCKKQHARKAVQTHRGRIQPLDGQVLLALSNTAVQKLQAKTKSG